MINIQTITSAIKEMFDGALRNPAKLISPIILICSLGKRPGLSCVISTANIIQNLAKEGIPTNKLPDGTDNMMNKLVSHIVCETYRALKEDASVQIGIAPGSITITGTGANAGGPVVIKGFNINSSGGFALIQ